jgi:hypothetical protein
MVKNASRLLCALLRLPRDDRGGEKLEKGGVLMDEEQTGEVVVSWFGAFHTLVGEDTPLTRSAAKAAE